MVAFVSKTPCCLAKKYIREKFALDKIDKATFYMKQNQEKCPIYSVAIIVAGVIIELETKYILLVSNVSSLGLSISFLKYQKKDFREIIIISHS